MEEGVRGTCSLPRVSILLFASSNSCDRLISASLSFVVKVSEGKGMRSDEEGEGKVRCEGGEYIPSLTLWAHGGKVWCV
jgi:hypothetical protein